MARNLFSTTLGGEAKPRRAFYPSAQLAILALALTVGGSAFAMTINPNFNNAAMDTAGLTAAQITSVHTAFNAAAAQFTSNFNDSINVNITVTAVAGTGTLGQSNTSLLRFGAGTASYTAMQAALAGDKTTADDNTAVLTGGSAFTTTDPLGAASHNWWVARAQAKAISLLADDLTNDGTFTFGAGFSYDFDPTNGITATEIDFQGVAMHEISEIMGRISLLGASIGGAPAYMLYDLFRYTGPGARGLTTGATNQFSIDAGATLLKLFNNGGSNGGDDADWASGFGNDSFNAFSSSSVVNPMTAVDLRAMDVIGYNRVGIVPEPSTGLLLVTALIAGGFFKRRATSRR